MKPYTVRIEAVREPDAGAIEIDIADAVKRQDIIEKISQLLVTPLEHEGWHITWTQRR